MKEADLREEKEDFFAPYAFSDGLATAGGWEQEFFFTASQMVGPPKAVKTHPTRGWAVCASLEPEKSGRFSLDVRQLSSKLPNTPKLPIP